VVGTAADAARITNQMRRATPEIDDALKRAPRQPSGTPPAPPRPVPPATMPPAGTPPKP
jgi:hypothetical protein